MHIEHTRVKVSVGCPGRDGRWGVGYLALKLRSLMG